MTKKGDGSAYLVDEGSGPWIHVIFLTLYFMRAFTSSVTANEAGKLQMKLQSPKFP